MTSLRRLARLAGSHEGRHLRRGVVAAAVVTLLGAGAGAASAYWSTAVTATSTATSAQLAITTANFSTAAYTFGNEALTTTGKVTLTNTTTTTSTRVPALTIALSRSSGSSSLAGDVSVTAWYQANGICTASTGVGSGAVTGTWASFPGITSTLAKSVAATYCIRSTIADRQDVAVAGGTASFVPQISAALVVGNFTATASATAAAGQATQYIYPLTTISSSSWYQVKSSGQCMDVSGGGTSASGTAVISYPCKSSDTTNQEWRFTQDGTTGYYDITPRSGTTTSVRADVNAATTSGSAVTVRTDSSTAGQLWQPQLVSSGTYQFVNKLSGLCLTSVSTSGGNMTQATCDGGADQRHTLTSMGSAGAPQLQNVTCVGYGYSLSANIQWTLSSAGPFTAQAQRSGIWYAISPASGAWADNAAVDAALYPSGTTMSTWSNATYPVRVIDSNADVVASGLNLTVYSATWGTKYIRCGS